VRWDVDLFLDHASLLHLARRAVGNKTRRATDGPARAVAHLRPKAATQPARAASGGAR